jgi:hypothetical protein
MVRTYKTSAMHCWPRCPAQGTLSRGQRYGDEVESRARGTSKKMAAAARRSGRAHPRLALPHHRFIAGSDDRAQLAFKTSTRHFLTAVARQFNNHRHRFLLRPTARETAKMCMSTAYPTSNTFRPNFQRSRLQCHCSYVLPGAWNRIRPTFYSIASLVGTRLTFASEQFVQFYYKTFDENRAGLSQLYVCDPTTRAGGSSQLIRATEGELYAHF